MPLRASLLPLALVLATACAPSPLPVAGDDHIVAIPAAPTPATAAPSPRAPRVDTPTPAPPPPPPPVPDAVRAVEPAADVGVLIVDRQTGKDLLAIDADRQFRSASLVKLLIAIDVLTTHPTPATRTRIATMLRLSDDTTATELWTGRGGEALVTRTARALSLTGTRPPRIPGRWGDVLLTARDVAAIYDHVMTKLPPADRTLVLTALATAPRHAADGFDQHFGIPTATTLDWAVKQGWSNSTNDIVTHTTGLVGPQWRYVVILLTEHPLTTRWSTATKSVTAGTVALAPLLG